MAGNGMPYFPLDCQLDEKFELLEAEFGIKGYGVVIKLFSRIYGGDGGYYCVWNDEVALLFASKVGVNINLVSEILRAAIRRGIFDEGMYHRYGILTSTGIQRRYFKAYRRRSALKIVEDYLLINVRNFEPIACKKAKIVSNSGGNVCSFEQSKEKKSKRYLKKSASLTRRKPNSSRACILRKPTNPSRHPSSHIRFFRLPRWRPTGRLARWRMKMSA